MVGADVAVGKGVSVGSRVTVGSSRASVDVGVRVALDCAITAGKTVAGTGVAGSGVLKRVQALMKMISPVAFAIDFTLIFTLYRASL